MKNIKPSWLIIFCLVFAGEIIFSLPFHLPRFFRPSVLDVFGLSNAGLGDVFAVYGVVAMLAYFPGGAIADRFSARKLMTASLVATALGGFYLAKIPGDTGLSVLFGYWGLTSILFFWAAMIKATREWGGDNRQGRAFGLLEGGRGLVAAGAASVAVWILAMLLPANLEALTRLQRLQAVQAVIYFYTMMTLTAALLVWWFIPDTDCESKLKPGFKQSQIFSGIQSVLGQRVVWLQAIIIVCAYTGYKGLDNYALYARDVLQMDELASAQFTAIAAYLRPVAAIATGFIVDRFVASRVIVVVFSVLFVSYLLLSFTSFPDFAMTIVYANIIISFVAVFGIRGVYFTLLEETRIAGKITGTAVGLVSVVGFTPDIFFAPISGRILDASPGAAGFQNYFLMLSGFAIAGMLAALVLAQQKANVCVRG